MREWLAGVFSVTDVLILWYFLWLNSCYAVLMLLSIPEMVRRYSDVTSEYLDDVMNFKFIPPISVIVAAFNEEKSIVDTVESVSSLSYPSLEIIVVNDGSRDATLLKLMATYDLYEIPPAFPLRIATQAVKTYYRSRKKSNLLVMDKDNGGKADAINAGINACSTPYFVTVDADTVIEKDALQRMIRPVLTSGNTIGAGGTIRISNGCDVVHGRMARVRYPRAFLPAIQVVEYLRAFLFGRLGWNRLGGNLIISGAFSLFEKRAVVAAGGYYTMSMADDVEIVVHLHRIYREKNEPYSIQFIPDPVAWTAVPSTWKTLGRQRERWHRGLMESLWRHRTMCFNPRHGIVGMISYPYFIVGEVLSPIVEGLGYLTILLSWWYGILSPQFALYFFAVAWGYSMLLSLFAVMMEAFTFRRYEGIGNLMRLLGYSVIENIGYRQYTVYARLMAFWRFFRGNKQWR